MQAQAEKETKIDSSTSMLLEGKAYQTARVTNHGYFPKDIVRYLVMRLRDAQVPCEVGYDNDLAQGGSDQAAQLRESFRDSKPFYFIAFPLEFRDRAARALAETSYPLPDDREAEEVAMQLARKERLNQQRRTFRKLVVYSVLTAVLLGGVYALISFSRLILD